VKLESRDGHVSLVRVVGNAIVSHNRMTTLRVYVGCAFSIDKKKND
jgi:hypothetical protein